MQRAQYLYGDAENFADGESDSTQYVYMAEPMVPDSLRNVVYAPEYSDGYSTDATCRRPSVLAPRYYKATRSRRRPTRLCLPVVSRPEPRRKKSNLMAVRALSDYIDNFLHMYDDRGEYAWPAAYQQQQQQQQRTMYAPARPFDTKKRMSAPLSVSAGVAAPRAPRRYLRKSEVPLNQQPIFAGQGLRKISSTLKNHKVSSSRVPWTNQFDYVHTTKPCWEPTEDPSEISESEGSQQFAPKTTSSTSVIQKCSKISSRLPKRAKHPSRNSKQVSIAAWRPKPRNSTQVSKQEVKQPKNISHVKNTKSEILYNLLRIHGMGDLVQQGHHSQQIIEEQDETQQTYSEAADSKSISSLVNAAAIRNLSTVQEDKKAASQCTSYVQQEAASQCTSYVQLDAGEAIEAVHSSSYTDLNPELCMKLTRTLTDKLLTTSIQSNSKGFIMLPEQPEFIKILKQFQRDHLEHILRETERLLEILKLNLYCTYLPLASARQLNGCSWFLAGFVDLCSDVTTPVLQLFHCAPQLSYMYIQLLQPCALGSQLLLLTFQLSTVTNNIRKWQGKDKKLLPTRFSFQ